MADPKKKTDAQLSVKVQLKLPMLPNFISTVDGRPIDVKDIPDTTLRMIGNRWTDRLIAHARERKGILDP
jgi:hypothetical protein